MTRTIALMILLSLGWESFDKPGQDGFCQRPCRGLAGQSAVELRIDVCDRAEIDSGSPSGAGLRRQPAHFHLGVVGDLWPLELQRDGPAADPLFGQWPCRVLQSLFESRVDIALSAGDLEAQPPGAQGRGDRLRGRRGPWDRSAHRLLWFWKLATLCRHRVHGKPEAED